MWAHGGAAKTYEKRSDFMSTFYGITEAGASTLFGSTSSLTSSTSSASSSSPLLTYMSIRNGSYAKLTKAYYAKTDDNELSINTSQDTNKTLMGIESSADSLKDIADELFTNGKDSLFNKTDENGKPDVDAIYKKVHEFVEAYNDLLEEAGESNTNSILRTTTNMINTTETYESLFKKVGITIGENNKLSVDEDAFKASNMTTVKSIFNGRNSLAYATSASASYISYNADYQASKANTYNSYGGFSYNYSSGTIYNSLG